MIHCNHWVYLITDKEDPITRLTLAKLMYDENNRGQMRGRIILCNNINKAVEHAESNNIQWAFFISPGQIFLRQFWEEFQLANHAMYAHIMHDAKLHYQCTAVDMSIKSTTTSGIAVSEAKGSRDYPLCLVSGTQDPLDILQKLAASRISHGVYNWPESLRNHKLHFYKKHWQAIESYLNHSGVYHDDWNSQHIKILDSIIGVKNRHNKMLWVVNNKKPTMDYEVDQLICPASGTFWLEANAKKVLVMDTNPIQLQWAKDIWINRPTDILSFTENWLKDKPNIMPNFLHSDKPNKEANAAIGLLNYNKHVEFILGDYYNLNANKTTIWISNIFTYEPNIIDKGLSLGLAKIKQLQENNQVIQDMEIKHGWI